MMPTKPSAVYWDTNTFIHRLERSESCIEVLERISDAAYNDELLIVTSSFTLCELAKVKNPLGLAPEEQERMIVEFFENPYIVLRTVDRAVGIKAREILRYKQSIKGKDAVHLATAVCHRVPVFHTFDHGLISMNGAPCLGSLHVQEPTWVCELEPAKLPSLFDTEIDDTRLEIEEGDEDGFSSRSIAIE